MATGRAIMAAAAPTLKRVFLELGGKSAAIVLDDADLAAAVGTAAFSVCIHAGQGCALTTRLLVPRERYDEAVQVAADTMRSIGAGDPTDPGTFRLLDKDIAGLGDKPAAMLLHFAKVVPLTMTS